MGCEVGEETRDYFPVPGLVADPGAEGGMGMGRGVEENRGR